MYDPTLPANNSPLSSPEMRTQLTGLRDLIDTIPQGDPGPEGPPGMDGAEGPSGMEGPPGTEGTPGMDGQQGGDGMPGADGQPGADGAEGPMGPEGSAGADGSPGMDGTEGPMGPEGQPGEVTQQTLDDAIATTPSNSNAVAILALAVSDPPTQGEMQQVVDKLDELITALQR